MSIRKAMKICIDCVNWHENSKTCKAGHKPKMFEKEVIDRYGIPFMYYGHMKRCNDYEELEL